MERTHVDASIILLIIVIHKNDLFRIRWKQRNHHSTAHDELPSDMPFLVDSHVPLPYGCDEISVHKTKNQLAASFTLAT
jgi:hypothetical protein